MKRLNEWRVLQSENGRLQICGKDLVTGLSWLSDPVQRIDFRYGVVTTRSGRAMLLGKPRQKCFVQLMLRDLPIADVSLLPNSKHANVPSYVDVTSRLFGNACNADGMGTESTTDKVREFLETIADSHTPLMWPLVRTRALQILNRLPSHGAKRHLIDRSGDDGHHGPHRATVTREDDNARKRESARPTP